MFGSLHTRSYYSFLQGASAPATLAQRAAACGHGALAITDLHGTYGAVELERACLLHNLRPIIGAEVCIDGAHLVLVATKQEGYASLCRLLTAMHGANRLNPHADLMALTTLDPSVAILTAGREGRATILAEERRNADLHLWLDTLRSHATGQLFVELNDYDRPGWRATIERLHDAATQLSIPTIVGCDVRHAIADDYAVYDAMTCIRLGINVFDHHDERPVNDTRCLRRLEELQRRIPYQDAFHNVATLAAQCSVTVLRAEVEPPKARLAPNDTPTERLRSLCQDAFPVKYGATDIKETAQQQLKHELDVISDLGLADFFLVVHEVILEARRRRIRTSGRGSAANSIVAYLLGITGVCPIQHNLLFERFLHKGRKGTPDIDVDFDSDRRAEMIAWMEQRFGHDHTAMTATLITYRLRMAVRDAAKALGWPHDISIRLSKSVPGYSNHPVRKYAQAMAEVVGQAPLLETLLTLVEHIEGAPRHLGQHSGGMILSQRPLWERTPVQMSANGVTVVQFDKDDVEAMGLVKFDVLGLRMLACISETLENIELSTGEHIDLDAVPLDDENVYAMMRQGRTLGVFQIESQGQMHLLAQHQPECFADLITEVALFRPGPLQGGMVHPYVRRRRGLEEVVHLHPHLEELLGDTLGIILFQEQVLEIAHRFAGMPLDEADDFRVLVSKNRDREAMEAMRERFINGAMARGVAHADANMVYEKVSHFVGYGFCRSHAAAFARIVYHSAWLKHYHPAAYLAAFMQHRPGFYNLMTLEEEARRCGVPMLLPSISTSGLRYRVEQTNEGRLAIRKPLTSVSHCSTDVAQSIVWARAERPFVSVEDLYVRSGAPYDALQGLALSGALDEVSKNSRTALWELGVVARRHHRGNGAQQTLFDMPLIDAEDIPQLPPMKAQERLAYDYTSHGAARVHPMTLYRRSLNDLEIRTIETAFRLTVDEHAPGSALPEITVAGIVILRQAPPTAHGVLFVTIEDETGFVQCVAPPHIRDRFGSELRQAALVVRARVHAKAHWRGLLLRDVRVLNNVIGGYAGHLAMSGGRDVLVVQP